MKHVAFYMRVSTGKQDVEMQKHAFEEWLKKLPSPPSYRTFKDVAMSGTNDSRPKFREMLARCKNGEFDHVVVYKLDRFSRSSTTAIQEILTLDKHEVGFVSISQDILNLNRTMPFRKAILAIFAELAEMEREQIRDRVKQGMANAKAKGVTLGRPKKITTDQLEKVLQLHSEGLSTREIAKHLPFSHGTVYQIVREAS